MSFTENKNDLETKEGDKPSRKKPMYPVNDALRHYLKLHGREVKLPVTYINLLNYTWSTPIKDKNGLILGTFAIIPVRMCFYVLYNNSFTSIRSGPARANSQGAAATTAVSELDFPRGSVRPETNREVHPRREGVWPGRRWS